VELLKSDPDDAFLMYALAMSYVSEGADATAIEHLQRVIDRDSDYVAAYFQQGQALAREGRAAEARDVVSRGVAAAARVGDSHAASEMSAFLETL
jgi:predicted Zn-dependent protease